MEQIIQSTSYITKRIKTVHSLFQPNTVTLKVNLKENYIEDEGAKAIAEMLKENCYIIDLVSRSKYGSCYALRAYIISMKTAECISPSKACSQFPFIEYNSSSTFCARKRAILKVGEFQL